ncbi:hypothetical protein [Streptomyces sp. NPDC052127]|uniref:hypothetical protein n=1 Tax=Streptomyces sp. NPDC052127 TaxID=3155679 RepID=UPI0034383F3C
MSGGVFGCRECRRVGGQGEFTLGLGVRVGEFVERCRFTEPCSESFGDRVGLAVAVGDLGSAGDEGLVGEGGRRLRQLEWFRRVEWFRYDRGWLGRIGFRRAESEPGVQSPARAGPSVAHAGVELRGVAARGSGRDQASRHA